MKAFLAYKGSGEDEHVLLELLRRTVKALADCGIETYCTHLQSEQAPEGPKMCRAFDRIDESDVLIALVTSASLSEGMLLEIGYACGTGKPVHVFAKSGTALNSFELAQTVDYWNDETHLAQIVKEVQWQ